MGGDIFRYWKYLWELQKLDQYKGKFSVIHLTNCRLPTIKGILVYLARLRYSNWKANGMSVWYHILKHMLFQISDDGVGVCLKYHTRYY